MEDPVRAVLEASTVLNLFCPLPRALISGDVEKQWLFSLPVFAAGKCGPSFFARTSRMRG